MSQTPKASLRTRTHREFEESGDQGRKFQSPLMFSFLKLCNFKQSWTLHFPFTQQLSFETCHVESIVPRSRSRTYLPHMCVYACNCGYVLHTTYDWLCTIEHLLCPTLYCLLFIPYALSSIITIPSPSRYFIVEEMHLGISSEYYQEVVVGETTSEDKIILSIWK